MLSCEKSWLPVYGKKYKTYLVDETSAGDLTHIFFWNDFLILFCFKLSCRFISEKLLELVWFRGSCSTLSSKRKEKVDGQRLFVNNNLFNTGVASKHCWKKEKMYHECIAMIVSVGVKCSGNAPNSDKRDRRAVRAGEASRRIQNLKDSGDIRLSEIWFPTVS